jgi:pyocin large subunit-like protein
MKQPAKFSLAGLVVAILAAIFYPKTEAAPDSTAPRPQAHAPTEATTPPAAAAPTKPAPATETPQARTPAPAKSATSKVGFTSQRAWQDHFTKHGAEFGDITADEYLARAKALRDAPLSKDVLEIVRESDGVISRFDKKTGGFVAFHEDKTIRTYFRPNDGEAYFRRQAER